MAPAVAASTPMAPVGAAAAFVGVMRPSASHTDAFEAALRLLGLPKELDTEQHFERLYAALCVRAPTVHGRKMRYADLAKFLLPLEGTFAQV